MTNRTATVLSVCVLLGTCGLLLAYEPVAPPKADRSKALIEAPPKALLRVPLDVAKMRIEAPPKALLIESLRAAPKPRLDISKRDVEAPPKALLAKTANGAKADMKKVAAGKVRWHADFKTATAKSAKSNKPVLLFQLLGQLDEEFT